MKRKFITIVAALIISGYGLAQISGKLHIVNEDNLPIANIEVFEGDQLIGITNANGNLENYTFSAENSSKLTYKYQGQILVPNASKSSENVVSIDLSAYSIDSVNLVGTAKINQTINVTANKMPLKDIENSQVVSSVSGELIKEQVITNIDEALNNATGVQKLWESTGRGSDGSGYYTMRGFSAQASLKNGLPNLENGYADVANVESVDVLKGPSGTLYGSTLIGYGGLINIVTKKPFHHNHYEGSFTGGSFDFYRGTVDINQVIGDDKKSAFRLNAAYTDTNTFQDYGYKKSALVAPSLLWTINDKLSFLVNTEFSYSKGTNPTMLFLDRSNPLRFHNMDDYGYDPERSYTRNDLAIENKNYNIQSIMEYKFNSKWKSQTSFSANTSKTQGFYSYLYEGTTTLNNALTSYFNTSINDGSVFVRFTSDQNSTTNGLDFQQNFTGEFNIGSVKNRLLVGLDYYYQRVEDHSGVYGYQGGVYVGNSAADLLVFQSYVPTLLAQAYGQIPVSFNPQGDDYGVLTPEGLYASTNGATSSSKTKQENYSGYISDVINVLPNLIVNAAVRFDRFNNFSSDKKMVVSPKFGLIYQPIQDKVAIFANYQNGFSTPQAVYEYVNNTTTVRYMDPEHTNQWEGGVKLNFFNDRFQATASYYDIKVKDRVLLVGDVLTGHYTQDAEQASKGVELSVSGTPILGWNVQAGYAYNDSEFVRSTADYEGRRPEEAGSKNVVNFWTSYTLQKTALKGLGVGFGGNYASKYATLNRETTGVFYLPEYTVLNASIFYAHKNFRISAKVNNLTDETYYRGWSTINPQASRQWLGSVSFNF